MYVRILCAIEYAGEGAPISKSNRLKSTNTYIYTNEHVYNQNIHTDKQTHFIGTEYTVTTMNIADDTLSITKQPISWTKLNVQVY